MLATAVLIFREVLEAALIISIVMAATQGVHHRILWVVGGVGLGLLGAFLLAVFADTVAEAASGMGQELFNALVLFTAVVMLAWHNIWMRRHGKALSQEMNRVGRAVASGEQPLYVLAVVVGLAVLREGAEVVLFLYSLISAEEGTTSTRLVGGGIGLLLGAGTGVALYCGLRQVPVRHLFTVTSGLILFLAAGLASQGAAYLVQADWLPPLGTAIWDTSSFLSEKDHILGQILHALIGYVSQPDGIQLIFYAVTWVTVAGLMWIVGENHTRLK